MTGNATAPSSLKPMAATLRAEPPPDADEAWFWLPVGVERDHLAVEDHAATVERAGQQRQLRVVAGHVALSARLDPQRAVGDVDEGTHAVPLDLPSFQLLQGRFSLADRARRDRLVASSPVTLMVFDLLLLDGEKLTDQPLEQRRAALEGLRLEGPRWRTPRAFDAAGPLLAETTRLGLEGV
ncbi:MAG TPA: hypothetical protein VLK58_09555, partial [Conexibacter sp.]|nr:hypothetical protein [Conexibacter sp.]